jgi:DNA-3-methyladenine glycosylase II
VPDAAPEPDETLRSAMDALAAVDDDVARAYAACGLPPARRRPPGFAGLVHIIAAQQVSAHAARAIVAKLEQAAASLSPETAHALGEDGLRRAGLSRPKARYVLGIADDVLAGRLDFDAIDAMDDEQAIAHLIQAKGVGRWSAEIYLLFALGRPDVWPAADLAVQEALKRLKRLKKRPDEARTRKLAKRWSPYRSAAARFLWHYYHHPGIPEN